MKRYRAILQRIAVLPLVGLFLFTFIGGSALADTPWTSPPIPWGDYWTVFSGKIGDFGHQDMYVRIYQPDDDGSSTYDYYHIASSIKREANVQFVDVRMSFGVRQIDCGYPSVLNRELKEGDYDPSGAEYLEHVHVVLPYQQESDIHWAHRWDGYMDQTGPSYYYGDYTVLAYIWDPDNVHWREDWFNNGFTVRIKDSSSCTEQFVYVYIYVKTCSDFWGCGGWFGRSWEDTADIFIDLDDKNGAK